MSEVSRRAAVRFPFPVCCYCHAMWIDSDREDVGRPLTDDEAAGGFFATHAECRPLLDALYADLASKGVFVTVGPA